MINELLFIGKANARTGQSIAREIGVELRDLGRLIEAERRQGVPICASSARGCPGYYLPATAEELERYTESLKSRAISIFKTRQSLLKPLRKLKREEQ